MVKSTRFGYLIALPVALSIAALSYVLPKYSTESKKKECTIEIIGARAKAMQGNSGFTLSNKCQKLYVGSQEFYQAASAYNAGKSVDFIKNKALLQTKGDTSPEAKSLSEQINALREIQDTSKYKEEAMYAEKCSDSRKLITETTQPTSYALGFQREIYVQGRSEIYVYSCGVELSSAAVSFELGLWADDKSKFANTYTVIDKQQITNKLVKLMVAINLSQKNENALEETKYVLDGTVQNCSDCAEILKSRLDLTIDSKKLEHKGLIYSLNRGVELLLGILSDTKVLADGGGGGGDPGPTDPGIGGGGGANILEQLTLCQQDPFWCSPPPTNPGGGGCDTGCQAGNIGAGSQVGSCTQNPTTFIITCDVAGKLGDGSTTWVDCPIGWTFWQGSAFNPPYCTPPPSGNTGGGVPADPCTSCGCPGYAACVVCTSCGCPGYAPCPPPPPSITLAVDCSSRLIYGTLINGSYPASIAISGGSWSATVSSDGSGNYSTAVPDGGLNALVTSSSQGVSANAAAACPSVNPIGSIDYCRLSSYQTTLYGWAYDPDDGANGPQPNVSIQVGAATQSSDTNSNYRTSDINSYLDATGVYNGTPRGSNNGFSVTFNNLLSTNSYAVSGTLLNTGRGVNLPIGVHTADIATRPDLVALGAQGAFPGNVLPASCLPKPYRMSITSAPPTIDDSGTDIIVSNSTHTVKNDPAAPVSSQYESKPANARVILLVRKQNGTVNTISDQNVAISAIALNTTYPVVVSSTNAGPLVAGDKICAYAILSPYSSYPGEESGTLQSTEACQIIAAKPFFKSLGDIRAGKSIRGWSRGSAGSVVGASTSGSVVSIIDAVDGVLSAAYNTQPTTATLTGPRPPKGLTFSNTVTSTALTPTASTYGGLFGSLSATPFTTPSNLYSPEVVATASLISSPTNLSNSPDTVRTYASPTSLVLNASSIRSGSKTALYVNGDVTIKGDQKYENASNFTSIASIPSLRIVATGNIFIDPAVTQLDGVFVAGGVMYTCHDGTWGVPISNILSPTNKPTSTNPNPVDLYATCNKPLRINGAIMAQVVKFTRTGGAVRSASNSDGSLALPASTLQGANNIAESFVLVPELYLAQPTGQIYTVSGAGTDAVTSLPPLF